MSQSSADNNIPLLTEVIAAPAGKNAPAPHARYREDVPAQPQPDYHQHFQPEPIPAFQARYQPTYDTPPLAVPVSTPMPPMAPLPSAEQLQQIRQEIQENLMQTLLGQVDNVLHQHLQDHLAVILGNMADLLKTRVRASLEQALAEEMAKFENSKY